jgi:hypothetical protein
MFLGLRINIWTSEWEKVNEESYQKLRQSIPQLPLEKKEVSYQTFYVDDNGLRALANLGLDVSLTEDHNANTMLVKLQDRISALAEELGGLKENIPTLCSRGAAVQISIPDLGLLQIDEVTHLDDACTNELQKLLNEGWRILAVCPPNAQRRPDYILGRRKRND